MLKIESGDNNNCVGRAIGTARVVLGLDPKYNVDLGKDRSVSKVVEKIGYCFPDNEVFVWCTRENFPKKFINNICYCGTYFEYDFDDSQWIIMYAYIADDEKGAHMVIGNPAFYKHTTVILIVAIQ